MPRLEALQQVKRAIREPFAWPGGYPVYTIMADGEMLCAACARAEFRQIVRSTREPAYGRCWQAIGAEVYWEGPAESCAHCGRELESAYGNPEEA